MEGRKMYSPEPYGYATSPKDDIIDEVGLGFAIGYGSSFAYNLLKGYRSSRRLADGIRAACLNAPRVGGLGARFTLTMFVVYNGLRYLRNDYHPLDTFVAGAVPMGLATAMSRGLATVSIASVCAGAFNVALDFSHAENEKMEATIDWHPTGPPGCFANDHAMHIAVHQAKENHKKKEIQPEDPR